MGIGSTVVNYYLDLYYKNFFKNIDHICELGDQEVLLNAASFKPVAENLYVGNPQESLRMQRLLLNPLTSHSNPQQVNARWLYQFIGIDQYTCIDINGLNQSLPYDLNKPLPKNHLQYDFVTNHGTTEHVFEQFHCFRSIHQLTRKNGYILHVLPSQNMYNHCFYFYIWNFYRRLAEVNNYELHAGYFLPDTGSSPMLQLSLDHPERILNYLKSSAGALLVLMQKKEDRPFRLPASQSISSFVIPNELPQLSQIDILLVVTGSKQLKKMLHRLSLELNKKTVGILILKEDKNAESLKKQLIHNLKFFFYHTQGYADTSYCRFQLIEMSLSELEPLPEFMHSISSLLFVPSEAVHNTEENIWDVSFSEHQIAAMDLFQNQLSISINEELIEQSMQTQQVDTPEDNALFSWAKNCVQDLLQIATTVEVLPESFPSSPLEQMWRYLMDAQIDHHAFYRFFPEGWLATRALLQQHPEHPLGVYLLMLYGRVPSAIKQALPSSANQENLFELESALQVSINSQIVGPVINLIRDYAIKSICDLGEVIWTAEPDNRKSLALKHGFTRSLDSLPLLYHELKLVHHQPCQLDEWGYLLSKPDRQSELVTNFQVSHYIFDQALIFELMHDLCVQNGYILHYLPCDRYSEQGLYLYAWPFYESLAETNNYDICKVLLHLPDHEEEMIDVLPQSIALVLSKLTVKGAYLMVLMRKNKNQKFITPFQTIYRRYSE